MKKILVLVANYPNNNGSVALMYVHVRNKYYMQHGIDVTVLNFNTENDYEIDDIKVISLKSYENASEQYDTLVSHAANLRNHYKFLKKYENKFAHLVFFFHGHEVVKINEVYPKPYDYVKQGSWLKKRIQDAYDSMKLSVWHSYYPKIAYKSEFIFVSQWFCNEAKKYLRLTDADLANHVHIINNSVGKVFEENTYSYRGAKKYDFITIRSYMDDSKYCVDLVDELARRYPQFQFLMIGVGQYYELHDIPSNVTWVNKFLSHEEIMRYIDQSKCGLLLTREDTQGVMTCELSAYGIPVITSDIDVCKEICGDLANVALISNDIDSVDLSMVYQQLTSQGTVVKTNKYSYNNTVTKEEAIISGGGYDFITIRNRIDESTYCIDLLCQLAERNKQYSFLLIGQGEYLQHNGQPENLVWINEVLDHRSLLKYIDSSRCALMLTRRDTQGVMSCELATYGIPLVTSDLEVCREVFEGFSNVVFVNNDNVDIALEDSFQMSWNNPQEKNRLYFANSTIGKELDIICR